MAVNAVYFVVVLGLGLISVFIGFLSVPKQHKKVVPAPAGNMGDGYTRFDYQGEKQDFFNEIKNRLMEQKPNWSEDYQQKQERRDVVAFSEYCNAGFLDLGAGDSGQ